MIVSIVFLWSGAWLTWAYYFSDMTVHGMFAFIAPMFLISGLIMPFAVIEEVR
jgi:hypothetical protein